MAWLSQNVKPSSSTSVGTVCWGVHLKYNLSNSPVNDLSHLEVLWCEVFALEEVEGFDLKV